MVYELALLSHIKVHNVFHASLSKKYVYDTKHVIDFSLLQVEPKGEFLPEPLHIMEKREVHLKRHTIVQLKVQWKHSEIDEANWENESTMRKDYPSLFHNFIPSP